MLLAVKLLQYVPPTLAKDTTFNNTMLLAVKLLLLVTKQERETLNQEKKRKNQ